MLYFVQTWARVNTWMLTTVLFAGLLAGCSTTPFEGELSYKRVFNFSQGDQLGWSAGFADYPSDTDADYMMAFEVRDLPAEAGEGKALYLASMNRSDDVFMFLKREIGELKPSTAYELTFSVKLASDAGSGCAGIGGAPGESVYLKAGASAVEPVVVEEDRFYTVNVDKGQQASGGRDAVVIGDVANGVGCEANTGYRMIERNNRRSPLTARTDAAGKLWIFVGTDSGYEGLTALYFTSIEVTIVEA